MINSQPVGAHLTTVVYEEKPLLEVALRNFTDAQAQEGGQPRGNRLLLPRHGTVKPLRASSLPDCVVSWTWVSAINVIWMPSSRPLAVPSAWYRSL